jgi:2'-5' RNA ligase
MQVFILLPYTGLVRCVVMRLFTAIDIPRDVKDILSALLEPLRPLAKLGWTPLDKMHITTKFIGEWPPERLDEMKRTLAEVAAPGPVEVSIRRLGWLPSGRQPRVLYAGVEASESLCALAAATERSLARIGIAPEDRIYRPHVTLARVRDRIPLGTLKAALMNLELSDFGCFQAASFSLYLSVAGKYTKLQEFPLNR